MMVDCAIQPTGFLGSLTPVVALALLPSVIQGVTTYTGRGTVKQVSDATYITFLVVVLSFPESWIQVHPCIGTSLKQECMLVPYHTRTADTHPNMDACLAACLLAPYHKKNGRTCCPSTCICVKTLTQSVSAVQPITRLSQGPEQHV